MRDVLARKMRALRGRRRTGGLLLLLLTFSILGLTACGWEPIVPPPEPAPDAEPSPAPAIQVEIVYECPECVQAEGGTGVAPLTLTFQAAVELPDPEEEEILIYSWDFGDGTKDEGERVTHTFENPGDYRVRLLVITSQGREARAETWITVAPEPDTTPPPQRDFAAGELCEFERLLPGEIRIGEPFQVQVTITTKQDVQVVTWEDNVWFPQFRLFHEPSALWITLKAGETYVLVYDVELWQEPPEDVWMSGTLSCNPGGFSESEVLTLRSELNVVREPAPDAEPEG